jgi:hypothetical protein
MKMLASISSFPALFCRRFNGRVGVAVCLRRRRRDLCCVQEGLRWLPSEGRADNYRLSRRFATGNT